MARRQREKGNPAGTIIGVVIGLGAVVLFLILVTTGAIGGAKPVSQPPSSNVRIVQPETGTGPSPVGPAPTVTTPGKPGEVMISFTGQFTKSGDTRKVSYKCPHCKAAITDVGAPKCLSCGKGIKWPQKARCGFCSGSGQCGVCKGKGTCPFCSEGPPMLMGVKPPCDACNQSGKCPACRGAKNCSFCEGGTFYPGVSRPAEEPPRRRREEPDEIPKPLPG
jgi:hypothetical protein